MQDTGCFPEIPTKYILTYFFIKNGSHHFNTYIPCVGDLHSQNVVIPPEEFWHTSTSS